MANFAEGRSPLVPPRRILHEVDRVLDALVAVTYAPLEDDDDRIDRSAERAWVPSACPNAADNRGALTSRSTALSVDGAAAAVPAIELNSGVPEASTSGCPPDVTQQLLVNAGLVHVASAGDHEGVDRRAHLGDVCRGEHQNAGGRQRAAIGPGDVGPVG